MIKLLSLAILLALKPRRCGQLSWVNLRLVKLRCPSMCPSSPYQLPPSLSHKGSNRLHHVFGRNLVEYKMIYRSCFVEFWPSDMVRHPWTLSEVWVSVRLTVCRRRSFQRKGKGFSDLGRGCWAIVNPHSSQVVILIISRRRLKIKKYWKNGCVWSTVFPVAALLALLQEIYSWCFKYVVVETYTLLFSDFRSTRFNLSLEN